MWQKILTHGTLAGLIVGVPLFALAVAMQGQPPPSWGVLLGYTLMLVALSLVFLGVKRHRDQALGGVIGFWPAFGMGLAISAVASVFYVLAWEAALAVTKMDFAGEYAKAVLAKQQAEGASAETLARLKSELDQFARDYARLPYRLAMTLAEFFPVGVLVSAVSAGLLRNRRFLPARAD